MHWSLLPRNLVERLLVRPPLSLRLPLGNGMLCDMWAQAQEQRARGHGGDLPDHGTWKGDWTLPSRIDLSRWQLQQDLRKAHLEPVSGPMLPTGVFAVEALAVTSRREMSWNKMTPDERTQFQNSANKHWALWLQHNAVQVLSEADSAKLRLVLEDRDDLELILRPRWVLTDKNDGRRTEGFPFPLEASARLIVPGFKDRAYYMG